MLDKNEALSRISSNIPKWMDGNKRPEKSVSGKFFGAVSSEQENLGQKLEELRDSFFLVKYIGKEDSILCQVYIAPVGDIDSTAVIQNIDVETTEDPRAFMESPTKYALLQDGYFFFSPEVITSSSIAYVYDDETFYTEAQKHELWNIFDEFAAFSSLTRYENESNAELMQRCLASFKNPTNSTEDGLKNAIINSIANYETISADNIKIEIPNAGNIYLKDADGEIIYDKLSKKNMDTMITKIWDHSRWDNSFATIDFIDGNWDKKLDYYQDGTGQGNDLKAILEFDDNTEATTDVYVTGYKASQLLISNYIRRQGIRKEISIGLKKYTDELVPKDVTYKITATNVNRLNPDTIRFKTLEEKEGTAKHYLSDIIMDDSALMATRRGNLEAGKNYKVKIYPSKDNVFKVTKGVFIAEDGTITNILENSGSYELVDNILINKRDKGHIDSVKDVHNVTNLIDLADGGFTLGKEGDYGEFSVDITGMKNEPITIKEFCKQTDYTSDIDVVKCNGFELSDISRLRASGSDSDSTIVIDMECSSLSFEMFPESDSRRQGSAIVTFEVDGKADTSISGLWTKPRKVSVSYGKLHSVKVTISKVGAYPVTFGNILAARYQIDYILTKGSIIETGDLKYLPSFEGENTLKVAIKSYGTYAPVINYIHIGKEITEPYTIKDFTNGKAGKLDISTESRIALYEVIDGKDSLIETNYTTKTLYTNTAGASVTVPIDISGMVSIISSSKPTKVKTYNGALVNTIEILPGESIDSIIVTGKTLTTKSSQSLREALQMDPTDELYCAGNAPGFIVKKENGTQLIKTIPHDSYAADADTFIFDNIPDDMVPCFVLNKEQNSVLKNSKCTGDFDNAYIMSPNTQPYIAYNQATIIQTPVNTKLVNTFSPLLNTSTLMFYQLSDVNDSTGKPVAEINFVHIEDGEEVLKKWSLGLSDNNLQIDYLSGTSNEEYCGYDLEVLKQTFAVSNQMPLKSKYEVGDGILELARYILSVPEDMQVEYETIDSVVERNVIAEEDGFNKLYYSNVEEITSITCEGQTVPANEYTLLKEAGIIVWNSRKYIGETLSIAYKYLNPVAISYTDAKSLYEMVGYSTDAYKLLNNDPKILKGMKDGETRQIDFDGEKADKIVARCSNTAFKANVNEDGIISVRKNIKGDSVAVHTGYYYEDGKEYYLFENVHKEQNSQYDGIKLENVRKLASELLCAIKSANYVKDSKMLGKGRNETLCLLDFGQKDFGTDSASRMNSLTACESYQMWNSLNMKVDITDGHNGNGISFTPTDKTNYALLNITRYIDRNTMISFKADSTLSTYLMEEVTVHDDHFVKSIFVKKLSEITDVDEDHTRRHVFMDLDDTRKYYLMVTGKGVIDDIIIRQYDLGDPFRDYHTKNITLLGYNLEEKASAGMTYELVFDTECNELNGLEFTEDGTLETGSNVEWGVTKLKDYKNDFAAFSIEGGIVRNEDNLVCEKKGTVTSPKIPVPNLKSAMTVYVKINDVIEDKLSNFDIKLMTAPNKTSKMQNVITKRKTNVLEASGKTLDSYVQFVVDMEPGKVINNIELYVKYAEIDGEILYAAPEEEGTLITKVYDTGSIGNWRPASIDGEATKPEYITVEARGCRNGKTGTVWTDWYTLTMDENLVFTRSHTFADYRFFQFRISVNNAESNIKINSLNLEVV